MYVKAGKLPLTLSKGVKVTFENNMGDANEH
jgi:hypothetical protein